MSALSAWLSAITEVPSVLLLFLLMGKLTILLAASWLLHVALGRRNPRWRVLMWRATASSAMVLVALSICPPLIAVSVLPALDARAARTNANPEVAAPTNRDSTMNPAEVSFIPDATISAAAPNSADLASIESGSEYHHFSVATWLVMVWCGGALLGAVGAVIGLRRLSWILNRTTAVPTWVESQAAQIGAGLKLRRVCEIRQTDDVQSPCLVGIWRPVILLPAQQCETAYRKELPSILAHELAHLKGSDPFWNAFLHGLSVLFWFHPLLWRVRSTHADACDAVCDALAVGYVGDATLYGRILARLTLRITGPGISAGLAMARTSSVARRIHAIRCHVVCTTLARRRVVSVVVVATVVSFALGGLSLTRSHAESPVKADARGVEHPETVLQEKSQIPLNEPGIISGEVVMAENKTPVAGATVVLRTGGRSLTTTDDRGRFRFEKVPPGRYSIWAYKDNRCSPKEQFSNRETTTSTGAYFAPIRLPIAVGREMNLTVTSAISGQPLEGAEVKLGFPHRRTASTGKEGVATFQALLPEEYQVTVQAGGHAFVARDIDMSNSPTVASHSFSLSAGGVLHGTVTDDGGKPLVGAEVVFRSAGVIYGYHGDSPFTDNQGHFRHQHLPLDTPIEISISMGDYLREERDVTLTNRQREQHLDFRLQQRPRGGSITGVVTDQEGVPIAKASVENYSDDHNNKREATTDDRGRFVLHDLLSRFVGHEIVIRARGFVPRLQKVDPGPANAPTEISIQLEKGHSIRGRVKNQAREPIQGAYISVNGGRIPGQVGDFVRGDDDGRFTFDSLAPGSTFSVYSKGYSTFADAPLDLDKDEEVVVTLQPMGVLRGRVVDADAGQPLKQFRVRLGFSDVRQDGDASGGFSANYSEPGMTFESPTGTFTMNDLTNNMPFMLFVDADGYERATVPRVVAHPLGEAAVTEIALRRVDRSKLAALSGKILDHNGDPIGGIQLRLIVTAEPSNGSDDNRFNWVLINSGQLAQKKYVDQYLSAVSDGQGSFTFDGLFPGKFLQIAYWGDKTPGNRWLDIATTKPGIGQSTIITLPKPASLRGSFEATLIPNAAGIRLSRRDDAFNDNRLKLAAGQTNFTFNNLPPGHYEVSIVGSPERNKDNPQLSTIRPLAYRRLTIEPGETYEIQFTADDLVRQQP